MIVERCNLCGCEESKIIWTETEGEVARCKVCGLIYSKDIPDTLFERSDPPSGVFAETFREKEEVYQQILELIRHKIGGRLLDVGCRTGNFMLLARDNGFDVTGVEPSQRFARFAVSKHLTVYSSTLKECRFPTQAFDTITYLEVLEHIVTPREELAEVHRILKEDGVLVLEIPNVRFQLAKAKVAGLLQVSGHGLMPGNHVIHFSERTCVQMLQATGFEVVAVHVRAPCLSPRLPSLIAYLMWFQHKIAHLAARLFKSSIGSAMVIVAQKRLGS